jgi:hypothetical protein
MAVLGKAQIFLELSRAFINTVLNKVRKRLILNTRQISNFKKKLGFQISNLKTFLNSENLDLRSFFNELSGKNMIKVVIFL